MVKIFVFGVKVNSLNASLPLHFAIHDATGKSIVVEIIGGVMHIHDNPVGVMTNSPSFNLQLTNLDNYINLSPVTNTPIEIDGIKYMATGQGSGMKGLPGDITPPDRFVKMTYMKKFSYPAKYVVEVVNLAQHIMNNVDIPLGFVRESNKPDASTELTQWTVYKDLTNKVFYYKTYHNTALKSVDLRRIDFTKGAPLFKMSITSDQIVVDRTEKLLSAKS